MASYIYYKIRKGFGVNSAILWAAISVSVVAWWAVISRMLEINTPPTIVMIGYMYLPFTGFSFILLLMTDLIGYAIWRLKGIKFKGNHQLSVIFILAAALLCYGYFEAKDIKTIKIEIPTDKLPLDTDKIRIVQISDLHIGKTFKSDTLIKTMEIARTAKPDLIVMTGDIVDTNMIWHKYLARIFASVETPLGKFMVTGNHEHYAGFEQSVSFMKRAGYKVLHSEWYDLGPIVVAGVDDPGRTAVSKQNNGFDLLSSLRGDLRNKFILFLKHRPHVHKDNIGLFDLQLSGHTHGGQIWPLGYLVNSIHGVKQGLSVYEGSSLYISNGTSHWGPPIRFLTPPEVTVIDIVRKK